MTVKNGLSSLFAAGYDLSGDVGAIQNLSGGPALLDVSSIDTIGHKRIAGRFDCQLGYNAWFNPTGAHVLHSAFPSSDVPFMIPFPGTAAGDEVAMLVAKQAAYNLAIGADLSAAFTIDAQGAAGSPLEWGSLITPGKRTDTAATASGTGIDLGVPVGVASVVITSASAATPTSVLTAAPHGLQSGDSVLISGTNKAALNNPFTVTVVDPTHYTVPVDLTSGAATGGTSQRTSHRGWAAQNQTFSVVGTSMTVTIQDSHEAVAGSFANLTGGAFNAVNGAARGAQRLASDLGILKRFVRVKTTGTFNPGIFACGIWYKEG